MKSRMMIVVALILGVAGGASSMSATMAQEHVHPMAPEQAMSADAMTAMCQQMIVERAAADARLDELVARMTTATSEDRMDAMGELLTELVDQRKMMAGPMMQMQGQMMTHMMGMMGEMDPEMSGSMQKMMQDMLTSCPMMRSGEGG